VEYCDQPVCLCVCLSLSLSLSLSLCDVYVCLSASVSLEPLDRSSWNFVCRSPVAVARSSSGGVALRYVLPVLWITSRLAVMGATPKRGGCTVQRLPWAAWRYRDGVWCLWMLVCVMHYTNVLVQNNVLRMLNRWKTRCYDSRLSSITRPWVVISSINNNNSNNSNSGIFIIISTTSSWIRTSCWTHKDDVSRRRRPLTWCRPYWTLVHCLRPLFTYRLALHTVVRNDRSLITSYR